MRLTIKRNFFGFTLFRGLRKDELQLREAAHLACDLKDAKREASAQKELVDKAIAVGRNANNTWLARCLGIEAVRDRYQQNSQKFHRRAQLAEAALLKAQNEHAKQLEAAHAQAQKWAQLCGDNNAETLADIEKLMPMLAQIAERETKGEFQARLDAVGSETASERRDYTIWIDREITTARELLAKFKAKAGAK